MGIWYSTREAVKSALDIKTTARDDVQVDRAIEAASRSVERLLHRRFYPELATRYFDFPNGSYARPWRLWLDENELISLTTLASGGLPISAMDYFLRSTSNRDEPPYNHIELDLSTNASFGQGDTWQRDIAVTGLFGYDNITTPAGVLSAAIVSTTATTISASDSTIGVGDLLTIDTERMQVTGKTMVSTGQTLQADLAASNAAVSVSVTTGTAYAVGEVLLLDAERMLIVDIAGNTLIVKRAWDGSVLATHSGSTIYAARTLTVTRGQLGTTAATHSNSAPIARQLYPGSVVALCVAEAITTLLNESSGYARTAGSGDNAREAAGRALKDARDAAKTAYGRLGRTRAV